MKHPLRFPRRLLAVAVVALALGACDDHTEPAEMVAIDRDGTETVIGWYDWISSCRHDVYYDVPRDTPPGVTIGCRRVDHVE